MVKPPAPTAESSPELIEVKITRRWMTMISYCWSTAPYCDLVFKLSNAEPVTILPPEEGEIFLDKPRIVKKVVAESPKQKFISGDQIVVMDGLPATEVVVVKISPRWVDLIEFCRETVPLKTMKIKLVGGEPVKMQVIERGEIMIDGPWGKPRVIEVNPKITPKKTIDKAA